MSAGTQPSRALLIMAGLLTQLIGAVCLILGLASIPVVHDLKGGMSGVAASVIAALAAIVCGSLVWRGRLVPLALAAGLDVGFGIGLPRGGSAIGAMLRMLPASEAQTAETIVMAAAIMMFVGAILCVLAVPSALKLRQWAREEIAASSSGISAVMPPVDEMAPTRERPSLRQQLGQMPVQVQFEPPPPPGGTLRGFGQQRPSKLMPTQVINIGPSKRGGKPAVIIGIAVTLIAIGIIVITAAMGSKPDLSAGETIDSGSGSGSATRVGSAGSATPATGSAGEAVADTVDAGADVDAPGMALPPIDEFLERFHAALGKASAADLALLFGTKAFAFGVEANDVAEGRDAVVAQLREDLGHAGEVAVKFSHNGHEGDAGWIAEELRLGGKTFVITAALGLTDGAWTIAALHWGEAMPNATAYKLAREGNLAVPDAIPSTADASPLAKAMQTAFASKPSFVDARSTRADAFNFGSASGERLKGGDAIKKIFSRINATIHLHDAVRVGLVGERGGWGIANVDFTDADRDGTQVTQTFRVLAVWVQEDAGWRIVQTQWSNAR